MAITRLGPNQDITAAKIAGQINFKNLIINGDMSIAQRGTSATSLSGGGGLDTVDRFRRYIYQTGTWTNTQSTDVPTGQGFANSWKWDCTTADASLSSGAEFSVSQRIAESTTVSFWVKSNKTGTYICELFDGANSRHINKSYTISSANTWEKKIITFAGDTTGAINNNNNTGLELRWWLANGTTWTSGTLQTSWGTRTDANRAVGQVNLADSTSNEWYITGVQLEADTSASDFEFLPYDVNLQRCQRYYQKSYNIGTTAGTATSDGIMLGIRGNGAFAGVTRLPVVMRTTPTLTIYSNTTGASGKVRNAETGSDETASTNGASDNSFNAQGTTSGISNVYQYQYVAEAEL